MSPRDELPTVLSVQETSISGAAGRLAAHRPPLADLGDRQPGCYSPDMEKVRIEAQLPAVLADQARAFVAEGCASDLDELLAEALRRFLESHAPELTAAFMKGDVQWGLHGKD